MTGLGKIYYRISENSYRKERICSKEDCLKNFFDCFQSVKMCLICDNVSDSFFSLLKNRVQNNNVELRKSSEGNSGAFKLAIQSAIRSMDDDQIVYLVEDDYLHLNDAQSILEEGFNAFTNVDYISLYDHPDKYSQLYHFGEISKIMASKSSHWKCTISTTMTFAARIKALKEDLEIWRFFTQHNHPLDHQAFLNLRKKGRILMTPIPGRSTHAEEHFLSPFVNWYSVVKKYTEPYNHSEKRQNHERCSTLY